MKSNKIKKKCRYLEQIAKIKEQLFQIVANYGFFGKYQKYIFLKKGRREPEGILL